MIGPAHGDKTEPDCDYSQPRRALARNGGVGQLQHGALPVLRSRWIDILAMPDQPGDLVVFGCEDCGALWPAGITEEGAIDEDGSAGPCRKLELAEAVRFELTEGFPLRGFSRPVP